MADRILNWHFGPQEQPAYYMEQDYQHGVLRVYARNAAPLEPLKVNIKVDGVSALRNGYAEIMEEENLDDDAGEFIDTFPIGSIVTCEITESGGASDITVQLELTE